MKTVLIMLVAVMLCGCEFPGSNSEEVSNNYSVVNGDIVIVQADGNTAPVSVEEEGRIEAAKYAELLAERDAQRRSMGVVEP